MNKLFENTNPRKSMLCLTLCLCFSVSQAQGKSDGSGLTKLLCSGENARQFQGANPDFFTRTARKNINVISSRGQFAVNRKYLNESVVSRLIKSNLVLTFKLSRTMQLRISYL